MQNERQYSEQDLQLITMSTAIFEALPTMDHETARANVALMAGIIQGVIARHVAHEREIAEQSFNAGLQWYFTHPNETLVAAQAAAKTHAQRIGGSHDLPSTSGAEDEPNEASRVTV